MVKGSGSERGKAMSSLHILQITPQHYRTWSATQELIQEPKRVYIVYIVYIYRYVSYSFVIYLLGEGSVSKDCIKASTVET